MAMVPHDHFTLHGYLDNLYYVLQIPNIHIVSSDSNLMNSYGTL